MRKKINRYAMLNRSGSRSIVHSEIEEQFSFVDVINHSARPMTKGLDPFDAYPIKMEPYMHKLLHFCESRVILI